MTHPPLASWLTWGGILLGGFALVSYFLIVPRISPALRDSGHANLALGLAGSIACLAGLIAAWRAGSSIRGPAICLALAAGLTGALAYYIHGLSYRMPGAGRVIPAGSPAPDFRLADQNGVERSLADFTARRLLLVFFRGHW